MTTERQPGLSTGLWLTGFEPATHLPKAAEVGYGSIELNIFLGAGHFEPTADNIADLKRSLADMGMSVWSIHSRDVGDLGHPDRTLVDKQLDELAFCLDLADELDASVIVSHGLIVGDPKTDDTDRDFQLIDILGELAPKVQPRRSRIAFENGTQNKPGRCAVDVLRRMIGTPRDAFGFVLDPGHSNIAGDLGSILYGHGQRLISTHLNDNDGVGDKHRVPGDGSVDWPMVKQVVDESPLEGPIMYEVIAWDDDDPDDMLVRTFEAHRSMFGDQAG